MHLERRDVASMRCTWPSSRRNRCRTLNRATAGLSHALCSSCGRFGNWHTVRGRCMKLHWIIWVRCDYQMSLVNPSISRQLHAKLMCENWTELNWSCCQNCKSMCVYINQISTAFVRVATHSKVYYSCSSSKPVQTQFRTSFKHFWNYCKFIFIFKGNQMFMFMSISSSCS